MCCRRDLGIRSTGLVLCCGSMWRRGGWGGSRGADFISIRFCRVQFPTAAKAAPHPCGVTAQLKPCPDEPLRDGDVADWLDLGLTIVKSRSLAALRDDNSLNCGCVSGG